MLPRKKDPVVWGAPLGSVWRREKGILNCRTQNGEMVGALAQVHIPLAIWRSWVITEERLPLRTRERGRARRLRPR